MIALLNVKRKLVIVLDSHVIRDIAFAGIFCTGLLLVIALITRLTNGLFFSRFPWQFVNDRDDPRFEAERRAGKAYSYFIFKCVPTFLIGFLLLLLWTYLS